MKRAVNFVHIISGLIPLLFSVCLLALYVGESIRKGALQDTTTEEATPNLLRSITTFLLPMAQISVIACLLLILTRFFFWKGNKPSNREFIFLSISSVLMIILVYVNPGHVFTWMMG